MALNRGGVRVRARAASPRPALSKGRCAMAYVRSADAAPALRD
jgi:hypothetical protein